MDRPSDLVLLVSVLRAPDDIAGDEIGLMLHTGLRRWVYEQSPRNAVTFASTGGDGVHFSLLDTGSGISNDSPVVMTVPMADQPNRVVGANLRHFLALGRHSGFFILEQLQYGFAEMVEELESHRWEQDLSPVGRALLKRMADEFALVTWCDYGEELLALERTFADQLDIGD